MSNPSVRSQRSTAGSTLQRVALALVLGALVGPYSVARELEWVGPTVSASVLLGTVTFSIRRDPQMGYKRAALWRIALGGVVPALLLGVGVGAIYVMASGGFDTAQDLGNALLFWVILLTPLAVAFSLSGTLAATGESRSMAVGMLYGWVAWLGAGLHIQIPLGIQAAGIQDPEGFAVILYFVGVAFYVLVGSGFAVLTGLLGAFLRNRLAQA